MVYGNVVMALGCLSRGIVMVLHISVHAVIMFDGGVVMIENDIQTVF